MLCNNSWAQRAGTVSLLVSRESCGADYADEVVLKTVLFSSYLTFPDETQVQCFIIHGAIAFSIRTLLVTYRTGFDYAY